MPSAEKIMPVCLHRVGDWLHCGGSEVSKGVIGTDLRGSVDRF